MVVKTEENIEVCGAAGITITTGHSRAIAACGQMVVVRPGETDQQALERLDRLIDESYAAKAKPRT